MEVEKGAARRGTALWLTILSLPAPAGRLDLPVPIVPALFAALVWDAWRSAPQPSAQALKLHLTMVSALIVSVVTSVALDLSRAGHRRWTLTVEAPRYVHGAAGLGGKSEIVGRCGALLRP